MEEDDIDIDVCLSCGRYYSLTQTMIDMWRASISYNAKEICPQLCHKCMRERYGVDRQTAR